MEELNAEPGGSKAVTKSKDVHHEGREEHKVKTQKHKSLVLFARTGQFKRNRSPECVSG